VYSSMNVLTKRSKRFFAPLRRRRVLDPPRSRQRRGIPSQATSKARSRTGRCICGTIFRSPSSVRRRPDLRRTQRDGPGSIPRPALPGDLVQFFSRCRGPGLSASRPRKALGGAGGHASPLLSDVPVSSALLTAAAQFPQRPISFLLKQIVLVVMVSVPWEVGSAGWRRSTAFDLPLLVRPRPSQMPTPGSHVMMITSVPCA
jgi:hypothetical protein